MNIPSRITKQSRLCALNRCWYTETQICKNCLFSDIWFGEIFSSFCHWVRVRSTVYTGDDGWFIEIEIMRYAKPHSIQLGHWVSCQWANPDLMFTSHRMANGHIPETYCRYNAATLSSLPIAPSMYNRKFRNRIAVICSFFPTECILGEYLNIYAKHFH